jgi:hypothetical protein
MSHKQVMGRKRMAISFLWVVMPAGCGRWPPLALTWFGFSRKARGRLAIGLNQLKDFARMQADD